MDYEIVTLEKKHIVGLSVQTCNQAPDMFEKIGNLWKNLYSEDTTRQIDNRLNANAYGLYTNYQSDVNGVYDAIAGFAVKKLPEKNKNLATVTIPEGRYAKFQLTANMEEGGIGAAWNDIWAIDLDRAYTVDFEEYLPFEDIKKAPVNIYIALRE